MIYFKVERLLWCFLLLFCVACAFATPVDNQRSSLGVGLGTGRHLDLRPGLNQNIPQFSESGQVLFYPRLSDGTRHIKRSTRSNRPRPSLAYLESQSSDISDLFAKGSDAAVESSTVSSVTTSKAFLTKEPLKSVLSDVTSHVSGGSSSKSNHSSSKPLTVPSEGGLMQDSSGIMSDETKNGSVMGRVLSGNSPEELQVRGSETGLSTEDTLVHHEDISVVKKLQTPQDSHISARKGATLPEKSEITSSSIHDTTEQFTFSSSESPFTKEVRPQKIAPRKGAELPKIYPRKGVEDKIDDHNSSDPIFGEENNGPTSISTGTASTPLAHGHMFKTTPLGLYASAVGLPDSAKDDRSTTDTTKLFSSGPTTKLDYSLKVSTLSTVSKSSLISPVSESSTPKSEAVSDIGTNISSNLTVSLAEVKNDTEDKSGIIASYPPLRKRLKPLKTTDTNTLNSSPSPPEHTSSEHDYIVPIVVTILTIPMLVVLVLFLYKKGSEFWERRHYRRMDFLIDGMYND